MGITPKDPADFDPSMGNYKDLQPFRFWCQKVLPLVYDDSLSYYEVLCKVVDYLNKTMEDVDVLHGDVEALHTAYQQLQGYVNDYFDNLDVQEEINHKLDVMASDGSLDRLIQPYFNTYEATINGIIEQQNQTIGQQTESISTLSARMDTFTHLTEGSTTGDAELADIRVGGNGITYSTAGDAVRAQYGINNALATQANTKATANAAEIADTYNSIKGTLDNYNIAASTPITLTQSYGAVRPLDNHVTIYEDNSWTHAIVDVKPGEIYNISCVGYGLFAAYVIVDADGVIIDGSYYSSIYDYNYVLDTNIVIPAFADKIYLNTKTSWITSMFSLSLVTKLADKPNYTVLTNLIDKNSEQIVEGYYNRNTGVFTETASYKTTAPIKVNKGEKVTFTKPESIIEVFYAAYWHDANKLAIMPPKTTYEGVETTHVEITNYPDRVVAEFKENGYVTITYTPDDLVAAVCVKNFDYIPDQTDNYGTVKNVLPESINVLPQNIISENSYFNKKCGFLGDSICEGLNGGAVRGWSAVIKSLNPSFTCYNYGISGACVGKYQGDTLTPVVDQIDDLYDDYPDCDFIIIEGGVNDAWGSHPIGTLLDTFDFNNWNDATFTGALEHTFYKTMSLYPEAKIGYIVPCVNNDMAEPFLDRAVAVCRKWHVPVIDFREIIFNE